MKRICDSQRWLSLLLVVALFFAAVPVFGGAQVQLPKNVRLRVEYLSDTYVPLQQVSFDTYTSFADYGISGPMYDPGYITPLHVLAEWMKQNGEAISGIDASGGYVSNLNGMLGPGQYLMFRINDQNIINPDTGWGYGMSDYPVQDNDEIVIYTIDFNVHEAYVYFENDTYQTTVNAPVTVKLLGDYDTMGAGPDIRPVAGAEILVSEVGGIKANTPSGVITAEDGTVAVTFAEPGAYVLSAKKPPEGGGSEAISRPYCVVNVASGGQDSLSDIIQDKLESYIARPVWGTDTNIVDVLKEKLSQLGHSDIDVTLKSCDSGEYIAGDGTISYYKDFDAAENYATVHCVFTLELRGEVQDYELTVEIPWDADEVRSRLGIEADTLTWDVIKGENEQADKVGTDLILPERIGDGLATITWSSSNINVLKPIPAQDEGGYIGKVTLPEVSTDVTLTALFNFSRTTAHEASITIDKTFTITVLPAGGGAGELADRLRAALPDTIDTLVSQKPISDWTVVSLARLDGYSHRIPGNYVESLWDTIKQKAQAQDSQQNFEITQFERMTLGIVAAGGNPRDMDGYDLIERIYNPRMASSGKDYIQLQGINAVVYGLIALDARDYEVPADASWTRERLIGEILASQKQDGGWAYSGTGADPDLTGAALIALAPYADRTDVNAAINKAIDKLSAMQDADGSYGNSLSTAQVIMGLCANGIDPAFDERFCKGNNSLAEALLLFKTEGGFSVLKGGAMNIQASEQSLYAVVQMLYQIDENAGSIFRWGAEPEETQETVRAALINKINMALRLEEDDYTPESFAAFEEALAAAQAAAEDESATVEQLKSALYALSKAIAALEQKDDEDDEDDDNGSGGGTGTRYTVKVSIDATVLGKGMYPATTVTIPRNGTVYDALVKLVGESNIQSSGGSSSIYISAIRLNGEWISESDAGPQSGWTYLVGGVEPDISCSEYKLKNGDVVRWVYTIKPNGSGSGVSQGTPSGSSTDSITINAKVSADGTVSAELLASDISKLQNQITKGKDAAGSSVAIRINLDKDAKELAIKLPAKAVSALSETKNTALNLENNLCTVGFDAAAVAVITESKSDVCIKIRKTDGSLLSEQQRALVSGRPVYEFIVETAKGVIPSLGQGSMRACIPYIMRPGENTRNVAVYALADDGTYKKAQGTSYNAALKAAVVEFSDLSGYRYAAVYEPEQQPERSRFYDVPDWAKEYVDYLAQKGIVRGKTETLFAPDDYITRAEFVTILARMSGADLSQYTECDFADIDKDDWFFSAVSWAAKNGVAVGADSKFYPHKEILRQDMAVMVCRYAEAIAKFIMPQDNGYIEFVDEEEISPYAKDTVHTLQRAGIIEGKGEGRFAPYDSLTRAECAKVIAVFLALLES